MLTARNARSYTPTAEDRLWLARAVAAEGRPYVGVARALVNLFMMQRSATSLRAGSSQTLASLVRAYAQPVNPRWFVDGDLYQAHARTSLEAEQARKREHVYSTRTAFTPDVTAAVELALSTPFQSDVTDYAVPSLDATSKGYIARGEIVKGENRFWTRNRFWTGYLTTGAAGSVAVVLLAVVTAWAVWGKA